MNALRDAWTNVTPAILGLLERKLHLNADHPIGILRNAIESTLPKSTYARYNNLSPIVTTLQNFDSLGFPSDHPGRSRTDTYYMNRSTVLRTHTSAHQVDLFRSCPTDGFLVSADVYRRDEIDRSHYPAFHQTEGARTWHKEGLVHAIQSELASIRNNIHASDPAPPFSATNPRQDAHSLEECALIGAHLKRTVESIVCAVFPTHGKGLQVRWVEAYFPFTSPSWELEVWWEGTWLELLGCGVVKQELIPQADRFGWAFGMGLERLAMVLFGIPDIRLFWSTDARFLGQFQRGTISQFKAYSRFPPCYKDIAFWKSPHFHVNDLMEVVRSVGGDLVEDVRLMDEFVHPQSGKSSLCFRINYRSMDRSLDNESVNVLQEAVRAALVDRLGVTLR